MVNAIAASLALFGASVSALGSAKVVNECPYEVYLCATPAGGNGLSPVDKTLQPGDDWEDQYTSLGNGAGWSIKLSKDEDAFSSNILQYEYTYQNDDTIWYDLSCVNGNPWDGDWMITSDSDTCNPKQQAYRYATDDAYGMQSCNCDSSITVTLCSGSSQDSGNSTASYPSASSSASVVAQTSSSASAVAPAYQVTEATTPVAAPTYQAPEETTPVASPTTFATSVTAAPYGYDIDEVTVTTYVTDIATATEYVKKRHQHRGAHHGQHA